MIKDEEIMAESKDGGRKKGRAMMRVKNGSELKRTKERMREERRNDRLSK